jgi:hypothetical protein
VVKKLFTIHGTPRIPHCIHMSLSMASMLDEINPIYTVTLPFSFIIHLKYRMWQRNPKLLQYGVSKNRGGMKGTMSFDSFTDAVAVAMKHCAVLFKLFLSLHCC